MGLRLLPVFTTCTIRLFSFYKLKQPVMLPTASSLAVRPWSTAQTFLQQRLGASPAFLTCELLPGNPLPGFPAPPAWGGSPGPAPLRSSLQPPGQGAGAARSSPGPWTPGPSSTQTLIPWAASQGPHPSLLSKSEGHLRPRAGASEHGQRNAQAERSTTSTFREETAPPTHQMAPTGQRGPQCH